MTNLINKISKLAMIPILAGSLGGCIEVEIVKTRFVDMNNKNHEIEYNEDSTKILLPTYAISNMGSTETYGDAKHPRKVSVGGRLINGTGYDFNEDGNFDKLEKENPADTFNLAELEKILNEIKEKAKNVDKDDIFMSYGVTKIK